MAKLVSDALWAKYTALMRDAHDTFNGATVTWIRGDRRIEHFNEQEHDSGDSMELQVLIGYNTFRTWPITLKDQQGEVDNQNMLLYINRQYLQELDLLTPRGYFKFNPDLDYFIHMGIKYKSDGDTAAAQAYNDPLFILVILRREETLNGNEQFEYPEAQNVIIELPEQIIITLNDDL